MKSREKIKLNWLEKTLFGVLVGATAVLGYDSIQQGILSTSEAWNGYHSLSNTGKMAWGVSLASAGLLVNC